MNHEFNYFQRALTKPKKTEVQTPMPCISISRQVVCEIMCTIGARTPETGGILLGPVGTSTVTKFYFDASGSCSSATYSPDHLTLRRKMKEIWLPSNLDLKGFTHSHPGDLDGLSQGDLVYIRRLLEKNPDMNVFIAPIVIPHAFRFQPIVVLADDPYVQRVARLEFI